MSRINPRNPSLLLLALCLSMVGPIHAQNESAQQEPLFEGSDLSLHEAELVAREAYRLLTERTRAAGSDLEITLSDFYTLQLAELDTVLWLDLVTMPGGAMIDVQRGTHSKSYAGFPGEKRVEYKPSWNEGGVDYLLTTEGRRLPVVSAANVLRLVGEEQTSFQAIQAITSYEVQAVMEGRERRYRAAILWTQSSGRGSDLMFIDNITQRVREAATEELEPITPDWTVAEPEIPVGIWEGPGPTPTECHPFNDPITVPYSVQRTIGHVSGNHRLSGSFRVDCRCAFDCSSSCDAIVSSVNCSDSGVPWTACHRVGIATDGSEVRGYGGGQGCAAAVMCGITPCLFCLCELNVSVEVAGTSVRFGGGGSLDTMTRQLQQTCPICQPCN